MGTTFRVLTFNTYNTRLVGQLGPRRRALGEILNRSTLDVVCLQEILWRRNLAELREICTTYSHAAYAAQGPAITGGLVTLSRWPVVEHRYVAYQVRTARRRPRLDWFLRKGLLITRFEIAGHPVTVVNTHLLANVDGDWSLTNRHSFALQAELYQLGAEVATVDASMAMLVMGDFNVPRDSWLLDEFLTMTGLRDVLAGDTRPTYRPTPGLRTTRALDHLLVRPSPSHKVVAHAKLAFEEPVLLPDDRPVHLSDHCGIECLIELCGALD
jgi:endonuclease/exonuclease/phosphatase family metal-dependent hydrolase